MSIREIVSKSTFVNLMNEIKSSSYITTTVSSSLNKIMREINKLYNDEFLFGYRFNGEGFYIKTESLRNYLIEGMEKVLEKFNDKYDDDKLIISSKLELYNELVYSNRRIIDKYHNIFFPKSTSKIEENIDNCPNTTYVNIQFVEIKPKYPRIMLGSDYKENDFIDYIYEKLSQKLKFDKSFLVDILEYVEGCVPEESCFILE